MYSYPNLIPLSAAAVQRIAAAVEPYAFDRIYGSWLAKNILEGGRQAIRYSARRLLHAIAGACER